MKKTFKKYMRIFKEATYVQEREIISFRSWARKGENREEAGQVFDAMNERENPLKITLEQAKKGIAWLLDQWKTPKGKERKHNPFGIREQEILEDFERFELVDFRDEGRYGVSHYVPVYRVIAKDGHSFDYAIGCWQSNQFCGIEIVG